MGKQVVDAGGVMVEVLEQDATTPSKANLDAWVNDFGLTITSVKDPDSNEGETKSMLADREHAFIVDLSNMKILQVITGSKAGIGTPSAQTAMDMMLTLLGNKGG
ncbi:MAG TPA: hypothetical protein VFF06_26975 [Polyangia bacterium]|nr:hypothetical protein [Polyangia bacterium]